MCLFIDIDKNDFDSTNRKFIPKIAKHDIEVYKIGTVEDGKFHPCFMKDFSYLPNVPTEYVEIKPVHICDRFLDYYAVYEGYHAFLPDKHYENHEKFLIKKGTPYFIGEENDIVASQIVWIPKKEFKFKDLFSKLRKKIVSLQYRINKK